MTTIEDELRDLFDDPRYAVPGWSDATGRVHAGVRRRRRRRATAVAACAATLVVAIAAAATASLAGGRTDRPARPAPSDSAGAAVVPWRDLPPVNPGAAPSLSPRPATTPCRTADLVLDRVDVGAASGTTYTTVTVHNAGTARCTLSGTPALIGTNATTGAPGAIPVQVMSPWTGDPNAIPATIDPGESADLLIATPDACAAVNTPTPGPHLRYDNVRLRLADGGQIPLRTTLDATCGVQADPWFRPEPVSAPAAFPGLTASIEAPATVRVGDTLEFVVTLSNPTGSPVRLDPCPNYSVLLDKPMAAGAEYRLNCAAPVVPAHGSVRFAMRLAVPYRPDLAGPITLRWMIGDAAAPRGLSAAATVTVRP